MNYSVATDYNNLNIGKGFKKGSTTVNVDGSPDTSLNLLWTTNLESGDDYILATDSFTANHTANTSSAIPVFYTMPRSIDGIISASNGLPSSPRNFTTSGSGLNFIASNNYFILDPNNPLSNIVTTGSALILDAKQISSYPQTESKVYDLSGNMVNGTLINGTAWNSNGWFDFDGIDDYISLGAGVLVFNPSATNFSMGGFLNITAHKNYNTLINIGGSGAAHNVLQGNASGYIEYRTRPPAGTSVQQIQSTITLSTGRWYHTYVVCDTINAYLYINGELNNTNALSGMPTTTSGLSKDIGFYRDSAFYFNGDIGPCQIYIGNALSTQDIKQNYFGSPIVTDGLVFAVDANNIVSYPKSGTSAYNLTGSNTLTLSNGLSYQPGNGGYFLSDGTDDGLTTPDAANLDIAGNFTVEGWVWWNQHKNYGSLLVKGPGGSGNLFNYCFFFYAGNIVCGFGDGSTFYSVNISTPPINTWHHIVGTYDGSNLRFYLNGVLTGTSPVTATPNQNSDNLNVVQQAYPINGRVASARVYNRALSASEILQNYQAEQYRFAGPQGIVTNGLLLYLDAGNLDSYPGTGTTWYDLSGTGNNATVESSVSFNSPYGGGLTTLNNVSNTNQKIYGTFSLSSANYTWEIWYTNNGSQGGDASGFGVTDSGGVSSNGFRANSGTSVQQWVGGSLTVSQTISTSSSPKQVVLRRSGTTFNSFSNGVLIDTDTAANTSGTFVNYSMNYNSATSSNNGWNGTYYIVRMYNRTLSDAEILQNYNAQKGRFGL